MNNLLQPVFLDLPETNLPPCRPAADAVDYLADESRMTGRADRVYFPRSETEILTLLRAARESRTPLTIAGGRTGIAGGSVPPAGWLATLEGMHQFTGLRRGENDTWLLRCQPGITLSAVNEALVARNFPGAEQWPAEDQQALAEFRSAPPCWFPPDPTEQTACLGGMAACNASGARTLFFGPTRNHIAGLRMALADGSILALRRGDCRAAPDGAFRLADPRGAERSGRIPDYAMPAVKNAAGYYSAPNMDLLDLFIGAEGTLGVFTEIEIILQPAPEALLGAVAFFPDEEQAVAFVQAARRADLAPGRLLALEFFDAQALNLLREQKARQGEAAHIPALPPAAHTAIYIEIATSEAEMEACAELLLELLETGGSDAETAWTAMDEAESRRLKDFRHALPETVNQRIGERATRYPGLTKLGTDFAVPDQALPDMLQAYHSALREGKFEYLIFGHIGNNHVHVNILPRDLEEYRRGKELYLQLARTALKFGGTVSAEHGVGKLKKALLREMYGEAGIAAMLAVKRLFDPDGIINPGNMFD